ncbi:MAG TPA: cytochrome c3 family protein [Terriglobia bacterium]|nr:cytochrome c3 family protein [Terriglobia bacterium]
MLANSELTASVSEMPAPKAHFHSSEQKCTWRTVRKFQALRAGIMVAAIVVLTWDGALRAQDKPPAPQAAKPQPLPFSHKLHTQFVQECQDCHQVSSDGWTMNYPPEEKCMTCHTTIKTDRPAIKKLADYAAQKKPVPWVHIYQVPDYVYFSHRTHVKKAKLDCEACHGPVREREVLSKEKPTSMAACISCHKEKGAPTGCRTCHDTI